MAASCILSAFPTISPTRRRSSHTPPSPWRAIKLAPFSYPSLPSHPPPLINGARPPPPLASPLSTPQPTDPPLNLKRAAVHILVWASSFLVAGSCFAQVAADSIRASGFGLKVAGALRGCGWPDEAIVFGLASLPVIELRGSIPVGYWMQLHPLRLTALSVLGNMVPVPLIILYLRKLASFTSQKNASAAHMLDIFFEKVRKKAGPVEEFQWLGLMLFVAVPFPGTGAWTGAIIASILGMPFWSAFTANFVGVVLAGLLVNLLVNLGLNYAISVGIVLFIVSTVMWNVLRQFKKAFNSD